jgi:Ca2+-binding RTX toxin-like protein
MAIKVGKLFGTDKLLGTDNDDLLIALGAKTTLDGGGGNDILLGGINDDVLIGGKGADFLSGGLGIDTADYSSSSAGVTVNLTTSKGYGGDAQGDTLISIENVVGSAYDDTLIGDKGNNVLTGGGGADIFVVTTGKDTITDFTPYTPVLLDFNDLSGVGNLVKWTPWCGPPERGS